jgi:hypothetical protein
MLAFAQEQGCQRVAASADEHGDGQEHRHDGHGNLRGSKAYLADGLAKEQRVDKVVSRVHHMPVMAGNGEFGDDHWAGTRFPSARSSSPVSLPPGSIACFRFDCLVSA